MLAEKTSTRPRGDHTLAQVCVLLAVLALNLTRELRMRVREPMRSTQPKRPTLWDFEQLDTREVDIC